MLYLVNYYYNDTSLNQVYRGCIFCLTKNKCLYTIEINQINIKKIIGRQIKDFILKEFKYPTKYPIKTWGWNYYKDSIDIVMRHIILYILHIDIRYYLYDDTTFFDYPDSEDEISLNIREY